MVIFIRYILILEDVIAIYVQVKHILDVELVYSFIDIFLMKNDMKILPIYIYIYIKLLVLLIKGV